MAFAVEDAFAALVDQVRTDRVFSPVKGLVPTLLLREEHYCSVIPRVTGCCVALVVDCCYDIAPDVGGVVSVEVDDLLFTQRPLILVIDDFNSVLIEI